MKLNQLSDNPEARSNRKRIGRGIGSGLLSRMLQVAEDSGVRSLYLEVRESNGRAREMYARRGFHEIGVRKGYYEGPREDARVLKKSLEGA